MVFVLLFVSRPSVRRGRAKTSRKHRVSVTPSDFRRFKGFRLEPRNGGIFFYYYFADFYLKTKKKKNKAELRGVRADAGLNGGWVEGCPKLIVRL